MGMARDLLLQNIQILILGCFKESITPLFKNGLITSFHLQLHKGWCSGQASKMIVRLFWMNAQLHQDQSIPMKLLQGRQKISSNLSQPLTRGLWKVLVFLMWRWSLKEPTIWPQLTDVIKKHPTALKAQTIPFCSRPILLALDLDAEVNFSLKRAISTISILILTPP